MSSRRHAVADPPQRAALAGAISRLADERQRLSQLEEARERARESSWGLPDKVATAEIELRKARESESSRIADEFITGNVTELSPISVAQQALDRAKGEQERISGVENALDRELENAGVRVRRAEAAVNEALADVILDSAEFNALWGELQAAWARLRGVKKAFAVIQRACAGNMPQQLADRWVAHVSLDPQATGDGTGQPIPTDENPATAWSTALEKLLSDPETALPRDV